MKKNILVIAIILFYVFGCANKINNQNNEMNNYIIKVSKMIENSQKLNRILENYKKIQKNPFISPVEIIKYYNKGDFYKGYLFIKKNIKKLKDVNDYYYFMLFLFKYNELKNNNIKGEKINNDFCYYQNKQCPKELIKAIKYFKEKKINEAQKYFHEFLIKKQDNYFNIYINNAIYYFLYKMNDVKDILFLKNSLNNKIKTIYNNNYRKFALNITKSKIKKYQYFALYTSDKLFEMSLVKLSDEILDKIIPPYDEFNEYIVIRKIRNLIYEKKYKMAMELVKENKDKYPDNETFRYYEKYIKEQQE